MANNNSGKRGHSLLAFFLGLLFGILLIGAAVAGVVIYALNLKLDKISANKDGDGNYKFVNANPDEGGADTVLDLVKKISAMAKDYNTVSLGEMEVLLPAVGKLTDKLNETLGEFVNLEEGELEAVKVGELPEFVKGLTNRINIASLIGPTPSNAILTYLCYGVSGLKSDGTGYYGSYKDEDGTVYECFFEMNESNGKISDAYYYKDGERTSTPYLTLENVNKRVDGVCNELTVGEIITVSEDDRILSSIKHSTINSIADDINLICIQQLFPDDIYAHGPAVAGQTNPKAEAYLAVNETPVPAAAYTENYLYYEVDSGSETGYKLAEGNGKLTEAEFDNGVADGRTFYTLGEGKILFDSRFVYFEKNDDGDLTMLNNLTDRVGKLEQLGEGGVYTYGGTSPLWKLLLYTADEAGVNEETVYNFKNLSAMINNVSKNTQNSTLRELDAAGILTFNNKAELEKQVTYIEEGSPVTKKIGEIELARAIGLFVSLVP